MNESIRELLDVAERFLQHLEHKPKASERDVYIEKITHFLDERQRLLNRLEHSEVHGEDLRTGKKLIAQNEEIVRRLTERCEEIQVDISDLRKQRETNRKYMQSPGNVRADGMFLDHRR